MKNKKCKFCKEIDHNYTKCEICGCEYCYLLIKKCPRTSWNEKHEIKKYNENLLLDQLSMIMINGIKQVIQKAEGEII